MDTLYFIWDLNPRYKTIKPTTDNFTKFTHIDLTNKNLFVIRATLNIYSQQIHAHIYCREAKKEINKWTTKKR